MTLVQTEPKKIIYGELIIISDMQGPCPDNFHIPTSTDWINIYTAYTGLGLSGGNNWSLYLKLPLAGYLLYSTGNTIYQGTVGNYRSSIISTSYTNYVSIAMFNDSDGINVDNISQKSNGNSIRPFKNTAVVPDSSWITIYQGTGSAGIFHNATLGLISISSDGTTWYTIADKNLGATVVWNSGDTLSESNCGKYYQRGNNYGFPRTGPVSTSTTQVNAGSYGPGNYYSSSTFVKVSSSPFYRDSSNNNNLRGGVSQGTYPGPAREVKAVYLGEDKVRPSGWQPQANTLGYWKLNGDVKDYSGNNRDGTLYNGNWLTENNRQYLQGTWSTNRSGAYVKLPIIPVSQFTACLRVKKTGTNSSYGCLFGIYPSSNYDKLGSISGNDQYYWSNVIYGNTLQNVGYPTSISNGWHMITRVVSNGQQKLYYDTSLKDTKTYTGLNFSNSNNFNRYINANEEASQTMAIAYGDTILESSLWDDNKVTEVYDLFKSSYGIS